ncbi:MAG: C-GCAxxG-C-C family protein [Eubacterium sp.]|nr:C-GCAxxG-C-C family protein [Eubacterium sp.]
MTTKTNPRASRAKALFFEGYNCSQAVAVAFSDLIGLDEKTAARLVSGFGGGMGRLREVCGSFSGVVFVLSILYGYDEKRDNEGKKELYKIIQELSAEFERANGSIVCRELLGLDIKGADSPVPEERTLEYYKKRPCPDIIYSAAKILEDYINKRES